MITASGRHATLFFVMFVLLGIISMYHSVKADENISPRIAVEWTAMWGEGWTIGRALGVYGDYIYIAGDNYNSDYNITTFFIAKYDKNGKMIWVKKWMNDTKHYHYVEDLAIDEDGNIYVCGQLMRKNYYTGPTFIVKYDSDGNRIWTKIFSWCSSPHEMVIHGGHIYIAGVLSLQFENEELLLLKYDLNGNQVWNITWGKPLNHEDAYGVIVGPDGYLYVSGVAFNKTKSRYDILVMKWSLNGTLIWNRTWNEIMYEWIESPKIKYYGGYLYVVGSAQREGEMTDVFLTKWTTDGKLLWHKSWGGEDRDRIEDASISESGKIYVTGVTESFGAEGQDILVAVFDENGEFLYKTLWGDKYGDAARKIAVISDEEVYIGGTNFTSDKAYSLIIKFAKDSDGDGIPDVAEEEYGTDPQNPDSDGDGLLDGYEIESGLNPLDPDSDGDGWLDGKDLAPNSPYMPNMLILAIPIIVVIFIFAKKILR